MNFTDSYYYNGREKINFKQLERDTYDTIEVVSSNLYGKTLPVLGTYNAHFHGKAYTETY